MKENNLVEELITTEELTSIYAVDGINLSEKTFSYKFSYNKEEDLKNHYDFYLQVSKLAEKYGFEAL